MKELYQLWRNFSTQVIRSKQFLVNNHQDLVQYLKSVKIQSAQQRKDFENLSIQIFNNEQDKTLTFIKLQKAANEATQKTLLQEIFTKQYLSIKQFGDKQLAIDNWQLIPIEFVQEYMEEHQIQPAEIPDAQIRILTLLQNKKPQQALKMIHIFQAQLDMNLFIDKFIQLDAVTDFAKICIENKDLLKEFLIKLSQSDKRHQQKFATELIRKHNLQKEDFPQLIKIQNRQAVDRTYFPKIDEPYERVEERLQGYPHMMCHVIEKLLEINKKDEAYSVAVRQGLNDIYKLNGKLLENPLFSNDGFGIAEEICYKQSSDEFVLFKDFNITEENIMFVDSVEKLLQIQHKILNSQITGFDTEFCHYFDEFAEGGVAIMQISTESEIFILDIFNLKDQLELLQFLNQYFASDKIKVGHSVWNDFTVMAQNMNLDKTIEPQNIADLTFIFNEVFPENKNNVSLANQVYQLFGKKLSKKECFSNWQRRPLRKCQLYYGAMDAYICIAIYHKLQQFKQLDVQQLPQLLQQAQVQSKQKKMIQILKNENLRYDQLYKAFLEDKKGMKFLVDSMLKKLAQFLRNLGFDAEYNEKNDHHSIEQQAINEQRVILTRDKKLFEKPTLKAPCFLLSDNLNTEQQYAQIESELKLEVSNQNILSRCVKCNYPGIKLITSDEAQQYLDFKNEDSYQKINEFWQCEKCLQVYWEGNQFKNSVERFTKVAKNNQKQ